MDGAQNMRGLYFFAAVMCFALTVHSSVAQADATQSGSQNCTDLDPSEINNCTKNANASNTPVPTSNNSTTPPATSPNSTTPTPTTPPTTTTTTTTNIATTTSSTPLAQITSTNVQPTPSTTTQGPMATTLFSITTTKTTSTSTADSNSPTSKTVASNITTVTAAISTTMETTKQSTSLVTRYPTQKPDVGGCSKGYRLQDNTTCIHLCEDKTCLNEGECEVVIKADDKTEAHCKCKEYSDHIYTGADCAEKQISPKRQRSIILGVLIPIACILLLMVIYTCCKLQRQRTAERSFRNKYDLNNL
ncbi:hypothetical protein MAR_034875 [Mya arenaria]|uniref:EGF-like domain-containing protein n=1 Tax=Mya arenaria TaxID=6604 RepID=A0ABY7EN26_MYAAR|nr:hypothetical protein MAR_034875 [Mya arenaria]